MEQKEQEVFWMVMNVSKGGFPMVRHAHLTDAMAEADRLAQKQPGDRFAVLQAIGARQYRQELTAVDVAMTGGLNL